MIAPLNNDWRELLDRELRSDYFLRLEQFVDSEYATKQVFPPREQVFNAFNLCPLEQTKVVILGQDPYHDLGQAHGLCFSVPDGVRIPPSLVNIYKEIASDLGTPIPTSGNLTRWASQGVLLLNATLTVEAHRPGSHQKHGWERFTDAVIATISAQQPSVVFMLWGAYAIKKEKLIDSRKHLILTAVHPSPLSVYRGFFGCKHFSQANAFLAQKGLAPIEW